MLCTTISFLVVTERLFTNVAAVQLGVTTRELYSRFELQLDD